MKRSIAMACGGAVAVLALAAGLVQPGTAGRPSSAAGGPLQGWTRPASDVGLRYVPGRVLVKFQDRIPAWTVDYWIASYRARKVAHLSAIRTYVLELEGGALVEETVAALNLSPEVEFAEPDYIASALVTPNDPFFGFQYALYNSGQPISIPGSPTGSPSADIKATAAWEETKGDPDVIIAVLDTGVDLLHPDLIRKLSSSGRDFVNDDFDASDDHGHGTFIAGLAAAETDNGQGIAGVAWNCSILPVKVLDANGEGAYSTIAQGITWAALNGARVINLSLGYTENSQTLRDAVKYAYDQGVVLCAGAGNTGSAVEYPAAYDDYCLAVAATDYNDTRPAWSNYGPEVDVAAPGVSILSTYPRGYFGPGSMDYGYADGTSAAAAHVSGLAALIVSLKPFLTPAQVMNIIRYSCDDINAQTYPGSDAFLGYGRINMEKALVPVIIKKKSGA
ncbi:MAG: hypothetical protein A2Y56_12220 [Candidatus Aminicenantes bacterium RBG_13_63_10]|nr:MAG: hypothetical protein A2Y56_12220 [Candidatus Aminicenantes bacterium RBG_13_63_10]